MISGDEVAASELLDAVYVLQLTPQVQLEHVSDSVFGFTGYRAEEYLADSGLWLRVLDPRDHDILLGALNADLGVAVQLTLRWAAKDGRTVWSQQISRKVQRPDGSVVLYGALNHITDQQIAEAQAGVDGRYRMLAEEASDVVLRTDQQGRILWVSDSVRVVAGWSPEELIGQRAIDLVDQTSRATAIALEPRLLAGETRSGIVVRIRTRDGSGRFISLTARPLFDAESGELVGTISGWRDVDELVRARLEAESERQILRAALDAQLDPQLLLEAVRDDADRIVDFRLVEVNPAACEALDATRADLVGKRGLSLAPQLQGAPQWEMLLDVVRDRHPLVLNDQPFAPVRGRGTRRFDVRAVAVHDGLSLTWRDVTERHRESAVLVESEARYRLLLEESSDMVTFHAPSGAVQWVSPAVERLLGWPPDDVASKVLDLIHRDDAESIWAARARLLGGSESEAARFRMRTLTGGWRWLEATARAVRNDASEVTSLVVFSHDVQEQMDYEKALTQSEERYRLLAENATDVVYRTSLDGTTEWVSEGVLKVLGFPPAEFIGRNGRDLVSPEDRDFVDRALAEVLAGTRASARLRMPAKDGSTRWIETTIHVVHDDRGQPVGFVGGWRDVQAEVEAEHALDERARTDDLTGLINRREAISRLSSLLSPDNPRRTELAVAFCDVDGFKTVNDTLGHAVGDRLLQVVAERVHRCVRAGDTVARVGGDEILLVLDGVPDLLVATRIADKVREAVKAPMDIAGRQVPVSVSIGVTMAEIYDDVDGLVARADRAMYLAKEAGRDRVVALD